MMVVPVMVACAALYEANAARMFPSLVDIMI
jgi:hypothetical protein